MFYFPRLEHFSFARLCEIREVIAPPNIGVPCLTCLSPLSGFNSDCQYFLIVWKTFPFLSFYQFAAYLPLGIGGIRNIGEQPSYWATRTRLVWTWPNCAKNQDWWIEWLCWCQQSLLLVDADVRLELDWTLWSRIVWRCQVEIIANRERREEGSHLYLNYNSNSSYIRKLSHSINFLYQRMLKFLLNISCNFSKWKMLFSISFTSWD